MMDRIFQKEGSVPLQILGALSLLCTIAIAAKSLIAFDIIILALIGFYLSARLHFKGCVYACILLAIGGATKHCFIDNHLWQLGLEGSLACGFFINALAFEHGSNQVEILHSQIETRESSLKNLEEELAKTQETTLAQQIAFQEKIHSLQKELEELQSEHASILILNDVLRKNSARDLREKDEMAFAVKDAKHQIEQLKIEQAQAEKEIAYLKGTDFVLQNSELIKELNQARFDKEQTHLINETLARLHLRETLKGKEAADEIMRVKEQLQFARGEIKMLQRRLELQADAQEQVRVYSLKLQELQMEKNFLTERLAAAERELSVEPKLDPNLVQHLAHAQAKVHELSQIEPLYKQLKKQFEEKNQILHQVRSELFHADTERQKLLLEKAAQDLNPLPNDVEEELQRLSEQVGDLEEENKHLQEVITVLSAEDSRKKKLKMLSPQSDPTQQLLF